MLKIGTEWLEVIPGSTELVHTNGYPVLFRADEDEDGEEEQWCPTPVIPLTVQNGSLATSSRTVMLTMGPSLTSSNQKQEKTITTVQSSIFRLMLMMC